MNFTSFLSVYEFLFTYSYSLTYILCCVPLQLTKSGLRVGLLAARESSDAATREYLIRTQRNPTDFVDDYRYFLGHKACKSNCIHSCTNQLQYVSCLQSIGWFSRPLIHLGRIQEVNLILSCLTQCVRTFWLVIHPGSPKWSWFAFKTSLTALLSAFRYVNHFKL